MLGNSALNRPIRDINHEVGKVTLDDIVISTEPILTRIPSHARAMCSKPIVIELDRDIPR